MSISYDIFPTISELSGVNELYTYSTDGVSLVDIFTDKKNSLEKLATNLAKKLNIKRLIITRGIEGSILLEKNKKIFYKDTQEYMSNYDLLEE